MFWKLLESGDALNRSSIGTFTVPSSGSSRGSRVREIKISWINELVVKDSTSTSDCSQFIPAAEATTPKNLRISPTEGHWEIRRVSLFSGLYKLRRLLMPERPKSNSKNKRWIIQSNPYGESLELLVEIPLGRDSSCTYFLSGEVYFFGRWYYGCFSKIQ